MKKLLAACCAVVSLGACGPPSCVSRGTRIRTPKGDVPVEDLAVGDEVISVDPETGLTAVARLVAITHAHRECGELRLEGTALRLTPDHPLYDPAARGFFPAGDWLLGHRSLLLRATPAGAAPTAVTSRAAFAAVSQVFDLTVDHDWHTFVAEGVVVHNKQPAPCTVPDGGTLAYAQSQGVCQCAGGLVGTWTCGSSGGVATCDRCGQPDGGAADAGP